jgi:predicted RNA-binding Zn-ribbon protein involved in translation (DUF1610 family)
MSESLVQYAAGEFMSVFDLHCPRCGTWLACWQSGRFGPGEGRWIRCGNGNMAIACPQCGPV